MIEVQIRIKANLRVSDLQMSMLLPCERKQQDHQCYDDDCATVLTTTSHAYTKTLFIATALAVCPSGYCHITAANIFASKLSTITGIPQKERLHTQAVKHRHKLSNGTVRTVKNNNIFY